MLEKRVAELEKELRGAMLTSPAARQLAEAQKRCTTLERALVNARARQAEQTEVR